MTLFSKGKYTVRPAAGPVDRAAVMALRALCFGAGGARADAHDAQATAMLVEQAGALVGSFRMARHDGAGLARSYAAGFYDLTALAGYRGGLLELGRFCIHPDHKDPDIARVAWAALTQAVDAQGITLLFGCASFQGTDPAPYRDAFALLKHRHLAPEHWRPRVKSAQIHDYAAQPGAPCDLRRANAAMPPLLRSYLAMGGWVSDHAVIDREMGTLHVFTALEIGAIPPGRKRLLRALV